MNTTTTEDIHRMLHTELFAFVRRRVPSEQDAEDIVQDVFERIHAKRAEIVKVTNITHWMYKVTRNAIVDHHRMRGAARRLAERFALERQTMVVAEQMDQDDDEVTAPLSSCVKQLVQHLPDTARVALTLTDLGGMSQKQAAAEVGISVSSMKSRVQRGREKLSVLLGQCCTFEMDSRKRVIGCERRIDDEEC